MSACPTESGITLANFSTSWTASGTSANPRVSCLPNSGEGWSSASDLETNGNVRVSVLQSYIASKLQRVASGANVWQAAVAPDSSVLDSSTSLSQTNNQSAAAYSSGAAALRDAIKAEYCYYYNRYIFGLRDVLTKAGKFSPCSASITTNCLDAAYETQKTNVENINRKLNQIILLLQQLLASRVLTLSGYYGLDTGVNSINTELNRARNELSAGATALKKSQDDTFVKSAMMDYTIEKNNSSRNLLAIYGFLNIVAVGTLYYLYNNIKS